VKARALGASTAALGLGLALLLWRTRRIAGTSGFGAFPLDDAWIHLQFARNLAEGHGFAYNPGVPVSGSTAPLWTLLVGGAFTVGGAHPALAQVLGIGCTLATVWLAGVLTRRWTGSDDLALLVSVLTALSGPMLWGALSGMEVSLAALLVTATLVLRADERELAAAVTLGLAALARPEALVLLPLCWLSGPLTRRRALSWALPVVGCLLPWVAFNVATVGSLLPGTAAAKIEGGLLGALRGVREPLATTLLARPARYLAEEASWLWRADVLLPLLVLPGLVALGLRVGRAAVAPACVLLAHPIAMAVLAPYRGPGFQEGRYSIHLLPLAFVVAVAPLAGFRRVSAAPTAPEPEFQPRGRWLSAASLRRIGALALLGGVLGALPAAATRYAWAVQNIEAMQVDIARWVAARTNPAARLALNDVGAITYLTRREIIDVMGLVTPAILRHRRDGEAGVLRYLDQECPDYLIVFPAWFPTISAMTDRFQPVYRVRLAHNTVAGADEMVVYESAWSRWREGAGTCPGAVAGGPRGGRGK
jgi:hypothetical protein